MNPRTIGDIFSAPGKEGFSCTKLSDGIVHLFLGKAPSFPAKAYCGKEVASDNECSLPDSEDYFCSGCENYIKFLEGKN